jgi:hyperosmotically inducible periplasmic protein
VLAVVWHGPNAEKFSVPQCGLCPNVGTAFGFLSSPLFTAIRTRAFQLSTVACIERIVKEVHQELLLLPYYGVFDNLAYRVAPDVTVTTSAKLSPQLKFGRGKRSEAYRGCCELITRSKSCPRLRSTIRFIWHAIYSNSVLSPYALRAVPPIIVSQGHVTLEAVMQTRLSSTPRKRRQAVWKPSSHATQ